MGHDKEDIQSLVSRCLHGNFQDASKTVSNQLNLATEGSGVGQWEPMIALAGGKGRGANVGRDRVGGPKGNRVLMSTGHSWAKRQREMGRKK